MPASIPLDQQPSSPPLQSPHQSNSSSPSLSRPRTPRPRNSPRIQPRIHRSSSYLSANGAVAASSSAEASPRLGPLADPQHHRAPSLGELYQELESEQEGRVNRLLGMIRQQQAQLDSVSATATTTTTTSSTEPPRSRTPSTSRPPLSLPASGSGSGSGPGSGSMPPSTQQHPPPHHRTSTSAGMPQLSLGNPSLRSPGHNQGHGHGVESPDWVPRERERDELAYYQAEAASVQRENKMLKVRIVELERLLGGAQQHHGKGGEVVADEAEDGDGRGRRSSTAECA